jgi:Flp pilus assembly protein TadD
MRFTIPLRNMAYLVLALAIFLVGCGKTEAPVAAEAGYVDSRLCESCHAGIANTYRETGMARAFHRIELEDVPTTGYVHAKSGRKYEFVKRDDKVFLRREEVGGGNVLEKEIHYVLGSGNHARSFIHRSEQGRLIEMPVNWYPENGGKVAMSPGYDRADHMDMRRAIGYQCASCHNGYAKATGTTLLDDPVFEGELPQGIDCQRCHGPGREHASSMGRGKIFNPKKVSGERKMEVCMQCHLETTSYSLPNSIVRFEKSIFRYDPREALGDFIVHFDHARGTGHEEKFEIAGSAYRLRQSKCFLRSEDKLTCTSCHDPHKKTTSAAVDAACSSCHQDVAGSAKHAPKQDCASCHMPKRRTEDVIHVAVTDHKIQKPVAGKDWMAAREERHEVMGGDSYRGEVVVYYPRSVEGDLYPALAQVMHQSNLKAGVARLEAALAKEKPKHPAYYVQMAQALHASGEAAKALPYYNKALDLDAKYLPALRSLGASQLRAGDLSAARTTLERTTTLHPKEALSWLELARVYRSEQKLAESAAAARKAIAAEPELVEAHKTLGISLLESGDAVGAEAAFVAALREQPDEAECRTNLGKLLAGRGDLAGAEKQFTAAMKFAPGLRAARFNYAMLLAGQRRYGEALSVAADLVKTEPKDLEALDLLGNLHMALRDFRSAAGQFRAALGVNPSFAKAKLGLGTALGAMNDFNGARKYLLEAANGSDSSIRSEAAELLRTLPAGK